MTAREHKEALMKSCRISYIDEYVRSCLQSIDWFDVKVICSERHYFKRLIK